MNKTVIYMASVLLGFLLTAGVVPAQVKSGVKKEVIQGITLVSIPAGIFIMGNDYTPGPGKDDGVNVYCPDEQPVHRVALSTFQLGATEITQGQYKTVMGENPSTFTGSDDLPVTNVSADSAVKFCNLLSKAAGFAPCYDEKTGKCDFTKNGFRLPTEAEWEYACRAGSRTPFNSGSTKADLDKAAWYLENSGGKTHPVARKQPNAWGLYDMHGNVIEFCYDGFDETYSAGNYKAGAVTNPVGCEVFNLRITRGGGWFSAAKDCRSATRGCFWTGGGNYYIGFRIARNAR